ncbi:MAG: class I SAM-dependent methyltransferase [Parvibaculum sp.]|nr:class I SAM-dependent methyltransferase [Parvibaculum sp.]
MSEAPRRFFDEYDRFLETSIVGNWPDRLNARYEAIVSANKSLFQGARVLDLASHDGRWTFAALDAGASSVVGIEVRPDLVATAHENMEALGVSKSAYRFEAGDIFENRNLFLEPFDVVLCLGLFYHTMRHVELLQLIDLTNVSTLILDTMLTDSDGNLVSVRSENSDHPANGLDDSGVRENAILVGVPTPGAVHLMLRHFGFAVCQTDWAALIHRLGLSPDINNMQGPENPLGDYFRNQRGTFVARRSMRGCE